MSFISKIKCKIGWHYWLKHSDCELRLHCMFCDKDRFILGKLKDEQI